LSVDEATGLDTANSEQGSTSPDKKKRNHKRAIAIVETEVRRSPRLKDCAKGFKSNDCSNKK